MNYIYESFCFKLKTLIQRTSFNFSFWVDTDYWWIYFDIWE